MRRLLLLLLAVGASAAPALLCTFDAPCAWLWHGGNFSVATGAQVARDARPGPLADRRNSSDGHFLLSNKKPTRLFIESPKFNSSDSQCHLGMWLHGYNMANASIQVLASVYPTTHWIISEHKGLPDNSWEYKEFKVSKIKQEFTIIVEINAPSLDNSHIAVDDLQLIDCFPPPPQNVCTSLQFKCNSGRCLDRDSVCDIDIDCPDQEDEKAGCLEVENIENSRCTFEDGWCGWENQNDVGHLSWSLQNGSVIKEPSVIAGDHTFNNGSGVYLYVNMSKGTHFGQSVYLVSPVFYPPPLYHSNSSSPYYNSCHIRFYYHMSGPHSGDFSLVLLEMDENSSSTSLHNMKNKGEIWRIVGRREDTWLRQVVSIPNTSERYRLRFEAKRGVSGRGDVAIDDISMSPECFGYGVPKNATAGYKYNVTYWLHRQKKLTNHNFSKVKYYVLTTCNKSGAIGPTAENCLEAYNSTNTRVTMDPRKLLSGVQLWTVPETGYYTIIAKGAKGGTGLHGNSTSRAAAVRAIVELQKGERLYVLVGQEGTKTCKQNYEEIFKNLTYKKYLQTPSLPEYSCKRNELSRTNVSSKRFEDVKSMNGKGVDLPASGGGGGGGGGGTFVFVIKNGSDAIPIVIAAGGGGIGKVSYTSDGSQHGQGVHDNDTYGISGKRCSKDASGAGGGWNNHSYPPFSSLSGGSLLQQGGRGGEPCSSIMIHQGTGGFGGGGSACVAGGGGGGFIGGDSCANETDNGKGGYSYVHPQAILPYVEPGKHDGSGMVYFIPAIDGCGCQFRCVALDEFRHGIACLCPENWNLADDQHSCIVVPADETVAYIAGAVGISLIILLIVSIICFFLYNRYQKKKRAVVNHQVLTGPDLQLNRLREAPDSMMTEYNPNYEFGGGTYTMNDLKDIPRDQLRLVKALGQGAFGEVYQGFFRHRSGDAVEMPVAVKTLPELSTNQAETDFLMEALIMSKFNHPNIVHFIGVCFDKHPRFIVLELLAGGDLKTFLRESRPKPDRPSPLSMKDLLMCAVDVAKGCKYMEENRFIHRDIAARNCLLTTKGPGRVVKIADFGMARDIYRADYYRKGGKAMLPIKWMPPEAFLDGLFTSKTDVWSFGVLLWEVMSLGYMPYTGCANREVMQLVTSGGRLEPPSNCPGPIYGVMTQCWHPNPEERPSFGTLLERLDYCMQDPDVINSPLPVFHRPPSTERDTTVMRPPANDDNCLQVQRTSDYLVPLSGPTPELPSSPSASSVDKLLTGNDWETSFVLPESRSTQPLLEVDSSSSVESEKPAPPNNNNNNQCNSLKNSIALDPAALAKQPLPYINVNMTPPHVLVNNDVPDIQHTGPFTVQAATKGQILADNEISC